MKYLRIKNRSIIYLIILLGIYLPITIYFFIREPYSFTPQTIAIILTGVVIIFYTWETYRLRKESQKHTEILVQPYIIVYSKNVSLIVHNIGNGPALNISFNDVSLTHNQKDIAIRFPNKIVVLRAGEKSSMSVRVELGRIFPASNFAIFDDDDYNDLTIELVISYQDINYNDYSIKKYLKPRHIEVLDHL